MQQPPEHVVFILEFPGRPIKAGQSFSAAFVVGYFDTIIDQMHAVNDRYQGHTALVADESGWRLEKNRPPIDRLNPPVGLSPRVLRIAVAMLDQKNFGPLLFSRGGE